MKALHAIGFLACLMSPWPGFADTILDLVGARLVMDSLGRVTSLRAADGQEFAAPNAPPAFELVTARGNFRPSEVTRRGSELAVAFGEHGRMKLTLTQGQGFAWLQLTDLVASVQVERLQLFCLPVRDLGQTAATINACLSDRFAAAVMGTEINVRARMVRGSSGSGDQQGCTHRIEPTHAEAKQGQHAARFTATSQREDNQGWSVVGRDLATPLNLTGCTAIRAWVQGDGSGALLKIQLFDHAGGYRDDYVKLDFTGWRRVTFAQPALNTVQYGRVTRLNFYYNGLPARRTATCLLDQVEAIVGDSPQTRIVLLEDFEDLASELWTAEGTRLCAETLRRFGLQPAGIGIIACPRGEFEKTIERFERAAGLPSPHPDGVWSKRSPRTERSYLFITGFAEKDTEDVIAFARRGHFDTILILQDSWCSSTGHYPINTNTFPGGLDSLRATVQRMQAAGFKVGLHYLAPSIYAPDPYLTPVPDPRLVRDTFAELATDIDARTNFIPTSAAPKAFPAEDGGYEGPGAVIQIGSELIQYAERSLEPPFGFRGCTRGLYGTAHAAHSRGARVAHLLRSYGYHLFDLDTSLLDEVADRLARVVNACAVDMIYWDGSERLQGEHWYYNAKLHKAFYDRFQNKDMFCQASSYSPYSWHIVSRHASADGHGDLKGYLDQRTPGFVSYRENLMPLDIGWYYVYDTQTTADQFEYVLNKALGFDASISLQTSPKHIREHPYIGDIVDLVAAYERLRLAGQVPEQTRARLREPKHDYHLVWDGAAPTLQRVIYEPWRETTALDGQSNIWEVQVTEGPCRVGVELQVLPERLNRPGPSYHAPRSLLLEDFSDLRPYLALGAQSVKEGVTQTIDPGTGGPEPGGHCAVYSARSSLRGSEGWSYVGRRFDPPMNLSDHKGIGFWLRGDGHGGLFKLQLRDDQSACDYYVANNYLGWRYHQLARPAKDPIDYGRLRWLGLYYNGLPGRTNVTCALDDIRALPALDEPSLENPRIELAGQSLTWPVTLRRGQALTAWPGEPARLSGVRALARPLEPTPLVELPRGRHRVGFSAAQAMSAAVRVRLTLLPPERLSAGQ